MSSTSSSARSAALPSVGGFFRAVFNHLANKLLVVREIACASQGHSCCTFVVASVERRVQIEGAIAAGDGDVAAVLQRFGEAR